MKLYPRETFAALQGVAPLKLKRYNGCEAVPVKPVSERLIEPVLKLEGP